MMHVCPTCSQQIPDPSGIIMRGTERCVEVGGQTVLLRRQQYQILEVLHRRIGRIVPQAAIYDQLYQLRPDGGPFEKIIDVQVHRLRRAIAPLGLTIRTIRSAGLVLEAPADRHGGGGMTPTRAPDARELLHAMLERADIATARDGGAVLTLTLPPSLADALAAWEADAEDDDADETAPERRFAGAGVLPTEINLKESDMENTTENAASPAAATPKDDLRGELNRLGGELQALLGKMEAAFGLDLGRAKAVINGLIAYIEEHL